MAKTWSEKFNDPRPHQIKPAPKDIAGMKKGEIMLIPSPKIIDAFIRTIPKGTSMDVPTMRKKLAKKYKAQVTCPITTGFHLRAVAENALEAKEHGAKLSDAALVIVQPQGRHRYWRLEGNEVAHLLESLMGLATKAGHVRTKRGPNDPALRKARICYDHLAGDYEVLLFDSLKKKKILTADKTSLTLTPKGLAFFTKLGIDVPNLQQQRRPLCKECLDWSVRRSHLAGALGASILDHIVAEKWAKKHNTSRVINFTASGEKQFLSQLCA